MLNSAASRGTSLTQKATKISVAIMSPYRLPDLLIEGTCKNHELVHPPDIHISKKGYKCRISYPVGDQYAQTMNYE
jgi:hypothetical protein